MIIYIGGDIAVLSKDILAIFDFEDFTSSEEGQEFFRTKKDTEFMENADTSKIPQSIILCVDETGKEKYYLSPISVSTLRKNQFGEE